MNNQELPPQAQLMKFIMGKWISKPIYTVAELGIPDILAAGPLHIEEIAKKTGTHAPTLYRVMRALASVGIFAEGQEHQFQLTPMAEFLKTGAMRSWALMAHAPWNDKAWDHFHHSVLTGETAFEVAHGMPLGQWLEQNPNASRVLEEANAVKAVGSHRAIIDVYNFNGIHSLADIGGGKGALMAELLLAFPSMKGVVADLPMVIDSAQKYIQSMGLESRCICVDCDFFQDIPGGHDAYLLSHILHDWSDEKCRIILANCRAAMKPDSKLLLVEMLMEPGNQPSVAKLLDLEMLVITGGKERTENEFRQLLNQSGFRITGIFPTPAGITLLEVERLK